ncbi:MAG: hypothetical protein CVV06_08025 [Gammaproteobacteria bacterium HGW-Gammaproteobacteria-10]|nr:MAG: hypothetical protein CVV06_08025 [Gammaproteobacteria bacterium HGW-Gammaproteobacteria-10]
MLQIDEYLIKECLSDRGWYRLYRAVRVQDRKEVTLKYLEESHPSDAMLACFRSEFDILKRVAMPAVIEGLDLLNHGRRLILVREYFNGCTLREYAAGLALPVKEAFGLIFELIESIAAIHRHGVIHGNLNPTNILVDPKQMQLKLLGLGRAACALQTRAEPEAPYPSEREVDYLAPEQSGRMNRGIDGRADIYGLGTIVFELFTGRKPFMSPDSIGAIHRHIAHEVPDPREFCPDLPDDLARIVIGMLAKDPEERYQRADELLSDLSLCRQALCEGQSMERTMPSVFRNPRQLYGREAELEQLEASLAQARHGKAVLCLVAGPSGVGKSRLIESFNRQSLPADSYFISAKCDQFQNNPPARLFHDAFGHLLQQILGEEDEALAIWRHRLFEQLGDEAAAVIELIPELELLLGAQPALTELPAAENKIRSLRLWLRFVQTFCRPNRPLCVFLDDLQWTDPALFEWLAAMLSGLEHLLLIAAYRGDEVNPGDGVIALTDKIRGEGGRVETIELNALPMPALTAMMIDSIMLEKKTADELCASIHLKTQGNPFFFLQYLRELQRNNVLHYDAGSGQWRFDRDRLRAAAISDNVVDFMTKRVGKLDEPVRELLKIVACIGCAVDPDTIGTVFGESTLPYKNMAAAETLGLLLKQSDMAEKNKAHYFFSHDRVQQAVHSLCSEHELFGNRLKIGRFWVGQARMGHDRSLLSQAVDHLNAALPLIDDAGERSRLGADNFKLGLWTKHRGAFEQALPYLRHASELLADRLPSFGGLASVLWQRAECEHLCGHHKQAERLFERAVTLSCSELEKARIFESMIQFHADQARFDRAYRVGRQAAALFGIDLPKRFNRLNFLTEFLALKFRLRKFTTDDLLDLPAVADARMNIAIRLLSATLKVAYQIRPELCAAISVKQVRRCLKHGNNAEAVIGYMVFGVIFLGGVLGNHQAGYDYGRLSLSLLDKYANLRQKAEVNFVYGYFANSWTHPAADTETYWHAALEAGLESGDWFHSGCACCGLMQSQLMRGVPLDVIWHESERLLAILKRIDGREHSGAIQGIRQAIRNLRGDTDAPASFDSADFDETAFVESLADYGSRHFAHYYYVNKMQSLYLWGDDQRAIDMSRESSAYLKDSAGMLHAAEHHFYTALILAKRYPAMPRIERFRTLRLIRRTEKNFRRWARRCPQNFQSRLFLLQAEIYRLQRKPAPAALAYQQAASDAELNGQLHLEGLANEMAGRLYREQGQERLARFHFEEAVYCYRRWGATDYLQHFNERHGLTLSNRAGPSPHGAGHRWDLETLLKAAETIAAERRLPDLLQTLMNIVIENAGAQRGVLLLQESGGLFVQAEARIDSEVIEVMQRLPLAFASDLPQTAINYVSRSRETVILDNAGKSPVYGRDKVIIERRVRSLLCTPLLLSGELQGVLYLENNAADAVFTEERVFLLRHLSGQIAISIDNAQGYRRLEDKVAERTEHIEQQKAALKEKNTELEARNATIEALNERLLNENRVRRLAEADLQKANEELQRLATVDGLTQIANRRCFDDYLAQECRRLERDNAPLALILCDIDHFKLFNDHYGHQAGDECLIKVAQAIAGALRRPADLAARYGGEEFAVVMPRTGAPGALQVGKLIQHAVADLQIPHLGSEANGFVTVSIGIATANPFHECPPESLIKTADVALYQVKENGRNGIDMQSVA